MSRQIDTTKPLSVKDRAYMLSRGRESELALLDGSPLASTDEVDEYTSWKVAELRDEADARDIDVPVGAHKAELVKLLENHDRASA